MDMEHVWMMFDFGTHYGEVLVAKDEVGSGIFRRVLIKL